MWVIKTSATYSCDCFKFAFLEEALNFINDLTKAYSGTGNPRFEVMKENEEYIQQKGESLCDKSEG